MENPTRRRLLVAGLAGTAATALVGQRTSATAPTEPPSTDASSIEPGSSEPTSAPPTAPGRPTDADVTLLGFAQQLELTARDLYQLAIDEGAAGSEDRVLLACHKNHQAAADALSAMLGRDAPQKRDDALFDEWAPRFTSADLQEVAAAGLELENMLVATQIEMIGQLEGLDGIEALGATLLMQSRMGTVLAHLSGQGDDPAALLENSARALTPTEG